MQQHNVIVLEGLDGAGTTTQSALLVANLQKMGVAVLALTQPSDGAIGKQLRSLLSGKVDNPKLLALMFAADRTAQWHEKIQPHLDAGGVVVCDRWVHSSLAYQGHNGMLDWVKTINHHIPAPGLTFYLDISPKQAKLRREGDKRDGELFDELSRQTTIYEHYKLAINWARSRGDALKVLDGMRPKSDLADEILSESKALIQS